MDKSKDDDKIKELIAKLHSDSFGASFGKIEVLDMHTCHKKRQKLRQEEHRGLNPR